MRFKEFAILPISDVPPCVFLKGDRYWVKRAVDLLTQNVDDFDKSFASPPSSVLEGLDKAESFPLLSEKRIVVLRDYAKITDEDKAYLEKYSSNPLSTTVFVLVGDPFKTVKGYVEVDCSSFDRASVVEEVEGIMERLGCSVTTDASSALLDYCGEEMGKISAECVKLSSYVGKGGVVDLPAVEECVTPDVNYKIYQIGELVAKGKYVETYDLVEKLGVEPTVLLANLTKYYRNVFYAKIYKGGNAELADYLKIKTYPLTLASKTARNYSPVALLNLLNLFYDLEYKVKSGATTGEEAMELAIAEAIERRKY